jgi:hypothetical protein
MAFEALFNKPMNEIELFDQIVAHIQANYSEIIPNDQDVKQVLCFDFDNDGDMDFLLSSLRCSSSSNSIILFCNIDKSVSSVANPSGFFGSPPKL